MATIFPYFRQTFGYFPSAQYTFLLVEHWVIFLVYCILCVLVVINTYKILIKEGKWRTVPLLLFYILATAAIYFRQLINIFYGDFGQDWFQVVLEVQPFIKFEVGVVQAWTTFEIALRLRHDFKMPDEGGALRKLDFWLSIGKIILTIFVCASMFALTLWLCLRSNLENYPYNLGSSCYLSIFIIMLIVNVFLAVQIRGARIDQAILVRERRYLLLILFLFELSYGMRFMYDVTAFWQESLSFGDCIIYDLLSLFDGLSFLALLLFHYNNFTAYSTSSSRSNRTQTVGEEKLYQRTQ